MRIETIAENRKEMANAIAEFAGVEMQYAGAPSFAYLIDHLVVNRDGSITSEKDEGEAELREFLVGHGFAEEVPMELKVNIPAEDLTAQGIRNLVNLLYSRQYLLNKALGGEYFAVRASIPEVLKDNPTDSKAEVIGQIEAAGGMTGFDITEDAVAFTFPMGQESEENTAYTELAAAMLSKAKESKRIRAQEHKPENEKYYFRVWLVSLGFDGADHKETRKHLLKNLKGHSAFRTDADAEKFKATMKEKRRLAKEGREQA